MLRVTRLAVRIFIGLYLISVVSGDVCTQNPPPDPACISNCQSCRKWKCDESASEGFKLDCAKQSPYIGGNQCCNHRILPNPKRRRRQAYNFGNEPNRKWPNPVGFYIDSTISSNSAYNANIRGALSHIQAQTCLRFTEVTASSTTSYINYTSGSSCTAYVGRSDFTSTPITTTSDCLSKFGEMLYYTTQTLGMWHQTQRPDRDQYVTINTSNVDAAHLSDFNIIPSNVLVTLGLPYDMASVKHFPPTIFSSNGFFTILTNDPLYQQTIGQRVQLSFQDSKLLNTLYCQNTCSSSQLSGTCQNGGYQDPNNCSQCRCPDGFSGQYCDQYETASGGTCGGLVTATATELYITSPGYTSPQYYESQIACAWHISAADGGKIELKFVGDFGLYEDSSDACYHWVEIRYKGLMNETGPRFCGLILPQVVLTSDGPEAMVIFRSNMSSLGTNLRRGFQIAYKVVGLTAPTSGPPSAGPTSGPPAVPTSGSPPAGPSSILPSTGPPSLPPSSSTSLPTSCNPNPCKNNGTCLLNGNSVSCQCINGFTGQFCTNAPCGGCNSSPGATDPKCLIPEVPTRVCQKQTTYDVSSGWWFCSVRKTKVMMSNVTCTWSVCCDNAVDLGFFCAVNGWSNWCQCSSPCGGGTQGRTQWGIRTDINGKSVYSPISTQKQNCNTQPCDCRKKRGRGGGGGGYPWYSCQPCNYPFVLSNGQCVAQ